MWRTIQYPATKRHSMSLLRYNLLNNRYRDIQHLLAKWQVNIKPHCNVAAMVTNKSEDNCQNRETSRNQEIEQENTRWYAFHQYIVTQWAYIQFKPLSIISNKCGEITYSYKWKWPKQARIPWTDMLNIVQMHIHLCYIELGGNAALQK